MEEQLPNEAVDGTENGAKDGEVVGSLENGAKDSGATSSNGNGAKALNSVNLAQLTDQELPEKSARELTPLVRVGFALALSVFGLICSSTLGNNLLGKMTATRYARS